MKLELYTKDSQGKCESVGKAYTSCGPMVGATINSNRGVKWQIVDYAVEYDRHNKFTGCSVEVKLPEPCDED